MNKKIKQLEWKTIVIGSVIVLAIVIGLATITSALADIVLYSLYKRPFHLSLFPKTADGFVIYSLESKTYSEILDNYYKSISLTIGLAASVLGYFLGGFISAKKAKSSFVLNGTLAGVVSAVLLLSWATPLYIACAYFGASLASRQKLRQANQ
jgi:hypothetical protein